MKEVLDNKVLEKVISYVKERKDRCIYLYVNLSNYDRTDENVKVYINDGEEIKAVLLLYFNTLHICYDCLTQEEANCLLKFVKAISPQVIYLSQKEDVFTKKVLEEYDCFPMNVYNYPKCGVFDSDVKEAAYEDYMEIAEFMFKDPTYSHSYKSSADLYNQLISRFTVGEGKYFYIKYEGKIVAVEGINAEYDDVVVLGGLLVDPNMRGMGLAKRIKLGIHYILQDQKTIYCLINNPISENMTIKLGGYIVSSVYKLIKRN